MREKNKIKIFGVPQIHGCVSKRVQSHGVLGQKLRVKNWKRKGWVGTKIV